MARLHLIHVLFLGTAALALQHIMVVAAPTPRALYHWQHGEPTKNVGSNNTTHDKHPPYGAESPLSATGTLSPSDCMPACSNRCSATQHLNACMYFCQYCCARCLCVPPGTYGNKEYCPCYNNMKNKEGGPKCP